MNDYNEFLLEAAKVAGYNLTELNRNESILFRKKIREKFTDSNRHYALWENLKQPFGIREPHSWEWIDEFLQGQDFYFFFEEDNDNKVYNVLKNQSLTRLLSEMPIKVFYITNTKKDFLLCYNDHEYLIAEGTAESWLRNKVKEISANGWKDYDRVLRDNREAKR